MDPEASDGDGVHLRQGEAGGPAGRLRFRRFDPAVVAEALDTVTPYCDVICAHLNDIADNNTRAAMSAIEQLGEVDVMAMELSGDVRQLAATVAQLRAQLASDDADRDPAALREHLADLLDAVAEQSIAVAERVEQGAGRLSSRSTAIVAEMQFEDIGRQMIGHVTRAIDDLRDQLNRLGEHLRGEVDAEAMLASLASVEQLRQRHVMDIQRVTHAAATGDMAQVNDLPAIELF